VLAVTFACHYSPAVRTGLVTAISLLVLQLWYQWRVQTAPVRQEQATAARRDYLNGPEHAAWKARHERWQREKAEALALEQVQEREARRKALEKKNRKRRWMFWKKKKTPVSPMSETPLSAPPRSPAGVAGASEAADMRRTMSASHSPAMDEAGFDAAGRFEDAGRPSPGIAPTHAPGGESGAAQIGAGLGSGVGGGVGVDIGVGVGGGMPSQRIRQAPSSMSNPMDGGMYDGGGMGSGDDYRTPEDGLRRRRWSGTRRPASPPLGRNGPIDPRYSATTGGSTISTPLGLDRTPAHGMVAGGFDGTAALDDGTMGVPLPMHEDFGHGTMLDGTQNMPQYDDADAGVEASRERGFTQ